MSLVVVGSWWLYVVSGFGSWGAFWAVKFEFSHCLFYFFSDFLPG